MSEAIRAFGNVVGTAAGIYATYWCFKKYVEYEIRKELAKATPR